MARLLTGGANMGTRCSLALASALAPVGIALAQGSASRPPPTVIRPGDIVWQPGPPTLEPGSQGAVLAGNPSQPGPFTLRVRLPARYRIAPHRHPVDERLTVLSGALCFATAGPANVAQDTLCIGPGTFRLMPANVVHSDWALGPVEYQIEALGPFDLIYVNPGDDPRHRR